MSKSDPRSKVSPKPIPQNAPKKLFGTFDVPEVLRSLFYAILLVFGTVALLAAVSVRLIAIKEFGTVIHEFDPWFNFRTTEFLSENGWKAFFDWYDYSSWYPLGRPVGTTTYPGLQLTAVALHRFLRYLGPDWEMSLNDICCYIPAWFGSVSTLLVGLVTYECSASPLSAVFAALIMALIPSHIVRTVGGGFDNECVAVPAMCAVFYFWIRSLRNRDAISPQHVISSVFAGLFYGFMVTTWGGFIYVTNIIALHAALLLLIDWVNGVYSVALYQSYSIFFVVGTAIATRVPPVGFSPFYSLEQISALAVFLGMQVLHTSEFHRKVKKIQSITSREGFMHRMQYIAGTVLIAVLVGCGLSLAGYFGPLTARVRSLLIQHQSTGNPLVDSVAEHQPMTVEGLWMYSSYAFYFAPIGAVFAMHGEHFRQSSLIVLNLIAAWHFAMKMSRLIIFACVPCAALSGIFLGVLFDKVWTNMLWEPTNAVGEARPPFRPRKRSMWQSLPSLDVTKRILGSVTLLLLINTLLPHANHYVQHCWESAVVHSQPQVVFNHFDGEQYVRIDDYREAYNWLKSSTPSDSRVLTWWDYGYHITGIANRTSLADGNTWNHEHIALIGKCLCSPVTESHGVVRHLADYVLLWTGGGADDLAKSPWIARISNSVYDDVCPGDPLCAGFGFEPDGAPMPLMEQSTMHSLFRLSDASPQSVKDRFERAFVSSNGLVSIYRVKDVSEESKLWVADPSNRSCPKSGKGYCQGRYPPGEELQAVLRRAKNIGQ